MRVKAVKSFGGVTSEGRYHISEGEEFELPEGVDWLRAGLVVPVKAAVETAAIEPPEKAVRPKARKRKANAGKD